MQSIFLIRIRNYVLFILLKHTIYMSLNRHWWRQHCSLSATIWHYIECVSSICPPSEPWSRTHDSSQYSALSHKTSRSFECIDREGQRIPNPSQYWPFAWQHSVQCFNELPNVTLEKRRGITCTPGRSSQVTIRRSYAHAPIWWTSLGTYWEKSTRRKAFAVRESALHLMNGHMNSLVNKHSHMPEGSVMLYTHKAGGSNQTA